MTGCRSIRARRNSPPSSADGRGFCGSPATVTEIIRKQMAEAGADYFVGQFAFGDLTLAETTRSIELFAREVMPALRGRLSRAEFRLRRPLRPAHPIRYIEANRSPRVNARVNPFPPPWDGR